MLKITPEEFKALWIKALESDEFKQGEGRLRSFGDEYCCLGVACEIAKPYLPKIAGWRKGNDMYLFRGEKTDDPEGVFLPSRVAALLGVYDITVPIVIKIGKLKEILPQLSENCKKYIEEELTYYGPSDDEWKTSAPNLNDGHNATFKDIALILKHAEIK